MATFRNRYHEELTVGWNGYKQTVQPDETLDVRDEIADDPETTIDSERWVRVDSAPAPTPPVEETEPE